jgi:tRNA threonylcarbamoyladenosine biosynthesis protein TsaB
MLVLALDTTTRQGSAALTRGGALVGSYTGNAAVTHAERLPGDLIRLLSAHSVRLADIDLFAVAAGPGSLTGLRIGIATQQGLALANGRPLVGVSALDAINAAVRSSLTGSSLTPLPSPLDSEVGVWMDAQRGQVYVARYEGERVIEGPSVEKPADVLERWHAGGPQWFAGDGASAYARLIRETSPHAGIVTDLPPLAPSVAHLAERYVREHGPTPPDAIQPIYVRRSDVELARDRVKS